jgi:hypothetical protein
MKLPCGRSAVRRVESRLRRRRRFGLRDAMIFVAATAAGLSLLLMADPEFGSVAEIRKAVERGPRSGQLAMGVLDRLVWLATWPMLMVTLATLTLRLLSPRPRWGRLIRQPGLVSGLAMIPAWTVAAALAYEHVHRFSAVAYPSNGVEAKEDPHVWLLMLSRDGSGPCGFAVAIAWATQALVGRWRPEDS